MDKKAKTGTVTPQKGAQFGNGGTKVGTARIDLSQCRSHWIGTTGLMAGFVYRCPNTCSNVQSFTADDASDDETMYLPVTCTICARVHLVNPVTGKVLGADDEE